MRPADSDADVYIELSDDEKIPIAGPKRAQRPNRVRFAPPAKYVLIDATELNKTIHLLNNAIRKRDRCALWPVACIGIIASVFVIFIASIITYNLYVKLIT